jgi:predicted enzyme related to lactoylglutathione lyase
MTTFRGFATLNVTADDVAAAARWYADVFGIEPYFERPGPDGRPAYIEFRVGDRQAEFGIVSAAFMPPSAGPGGAVMPSPIMHWHVDDLDGTVARLLALGATEYLPSRSAARGSSRRRSSTRSATSSAS